MLIAFNKEESFLLFSVCEVVPRGSLGRMRQVYYELSKKVSRSLEASSRCPEGLVKLMTLGWLAPRGVPSFGKGRSVICDGNRFNDLADVGVQAC